MFHLCYVNNDKQKQRNMNTLTDKVILVTGASRGIGAAIARKLSSEGAKIIVNYAGGKDAADQVVDGHPRAGQGEALLRDGLPRRQQPDEGGKNQRFFHDRLRFLRQ